MRRNTAARGVAVLLLGASVTYGQSRSRNEYPPLGKLVDVGGYRVHLYCTGSGSPTAMIVGAGFSFDWGLVQPAVARDTRVCTYDPAGSAWSDPSPVVPTCTQRIDEIHAVIERGGVHGPLVLVGHSIGAVFARLYAERFPADVAGVVLVDHAAVVRMAAGAPGAAGSLPSGVVLGRGVVLPPGVRLPPPPGVGPASVEEDPAFRRLPALDQRLHQWASELPDPQPSQAQRRLFDDCLARIDSMDAKRAHPLGAKPLVVISNALTVPDYLSLQKRLASLSSNSASIAADSSGHMIPLDQPSAVVHGIDIVVRAVRTKAAVAP